MRFIIHNQAMFNAFKNLFLFFGMIGLTAFMTPTKPTIHFASANAIAIKYSAYNVLPTVTAEVIDMAVVHCKKHGKGMKLVNSIYK